MLILFDDIAAQPTSNGYNSRDWVFPTSILQRKWCLYRQTHCLLQLWSLSMRSPDLKIILQLRPSVFKFNLKRTVIFLYKNFRICNRRKQGEPVPPRKFWTWFFTNPASKHLLGFSQTRHSAQNCAECASYPPKALWPTRGLVPSSSLFFRQSFPCFFLQAAESNVFSKLFVDTARFLW